MRPQYEKYKRRGLSEMRHYDPKEKWDYKISVSAEDLKNGSPKEGDMIARNPKNHEDQWLVAKKYFEDNLELAIADKEPIDSDAYYNRNKLFERQPDKEKQSEVSAEQWLRSYKYTPDLMFSWEWTIRALEEYAALKGK